MLGEEFPTPTNNSRQGISKGVYEFNSILTLSTQRQHHFPQGKDSVLQDTPHFRCQAQARLSPALLSDQLQIGPPPQGLIC